VSGQVFTFVTAVMDRGRVPEGGWRAWFIAECAGFEGFVIDEAAGEITHDGALSGLCRFIEHDEARPLFDDDPWYQDPVACPFLGTVLGYFTWSSVTRGDAFARTIAYVGRGVVARPREGWSRCPVALVTLRVTDAIDRYGLRHTLLGRDDTAYLDDVVARIRAVVAQAGFDDRDIGHYDAHRNPIAAGETIRRLRDGKQLPTTRALSGLTVDLWGFVGDFEQGSFWYD
jgi:hypothetical protein